MKKILAAFDGYKYSPATASYAEEFAQMAKSYLVGVFLDEFIYRTYNVGSIYKKYKNPEAVIKKLDAKDKMKRDEAVAKFEKGCTNAKISFSVHRNKSIALQELKHESIFADLLIINKNETFNHYAEKLPTRFIQDLLANAQCPILITPVAYKPISKIVLLYDGSPSSVYAVKMFAYTFNDINLPVEVFTVNEPLIGSHVPDNKLMKEFIKRHFPNAHYVVARGHAETEIQRYLHGHKENLMVIMGAYRRSEVSRWFKSSMADTLMKDFEFPLFIAHYK